jgi:hypothetical protein
LPKKSRTIKIPDLLERIFSWLDDRPDMSGPIAIRAALRVLPLAFHGGAPRNASWQERFLLQTFRASFVAWSTSKYWRYGRRPAGILAANGNAAAAINIGAAKKFVVPASAGVAVLSAGLTAAAPRSMEAAKQAATVIMSAFAAVQEEDADLFILRSVIADMDEAPANSTAGHAQRPQFMAQPLWTIEVRQGANFGVNLPIWARVPWDEFKGAPIAQEAKFQRWIRWYDGVLTGRESGHLDANIGGKFEREFVERLVVQDDKFWQRPAQKVNSDIDRMVEEVKEQQRVARLEKKEKNTPEVEQPILVQRPSSHRFEWRENRLEAIAVVEPPFDAVLADSIIAELRQKISETLDALTGNNADEVVERALTRLSETIGASSVEVAEGILLMRSNTIAAHSRSYADANSERERAIRAALDDVSLSLDSLVACYPGIRRVSANRLALDMQAEAADQVEGTLGEVRRLASASHIISPSSPVALDTGGDELVGINKKLSYETNASRIAAYIEARGKVVASRLLDATNFVSAVLQRGGGELSGLSKDTWSEIRKSFPKAAAQGVAKGTEAVIEKAPVVALAYAIAGPWAALAALVPRLSGHARKASEIKDKIERKLLDE